MVVDDGVDGAAAAAADDDDIPSRFIVQDTVAVSWVVYLLPGDWGCLWGVCHDETTERKVALR